MQFQCLNCNVYFVSGKQTTACPFCNSDNTSAVKEIEIKSGIQIEEFLIDEKIGEGAISQVFKAKDVKNKIDVVVKLPKNLFKNDVRYRKRYESEANILKSIKHKNVLRLIKTLEINGNIALITEHIDGTDLQKFLLLEGSIPLDLAIEYLTQASLGLEQAHQKGIIHRDIKPENFLVSRENVLKVADFGLSKSRSTYADFADKHEYVSFQGTPAYSAPEQIRGKNPTILSDIYSLGITAYQLCTGKLPFETGTVDTILFEHLNAEIQPARLLNPAIPKSLERLIADMTAKNPDLRPASMLEVHDKLIEIKNSLTVRNTDFIEKKPRKTANHVYVFAAFLLVLVAVGFQFTRMYFRNLERTKIPTEKPTNTEMDFVSLLNNTNEVVDTNSFSPNVTELGDVYILDEFLSFRHSTKEIFDCNEGKDYLHSFRVSFPNADEIPSWDLFKSLRITENKKYILLQFTEITVLGEIQDNFFRHKLSLPKSMYINTFFNDSEECFICFHEDYCDVITITPDNINVQKLDLQLDSAEISSITGTPDKLKYILRCTQYDNWVYKILEIDTADDGSFEAIIPDSTLEGYKTDEMLGCNMNVNVFVMHRYEQIMIVKVVENGPNHEYYVNKLLGIESKNIEAAISNSGKFLLLLCENPDDKTKFELRVYNLETKELVTSKEISIPKDTTVNFANIYLKYKPDKIVLSINLTDSDYTFNQVFMLTDVNK